MENETTLYVPVWMAEMLSDGPMAGEACAIQIIERFKSDLAERINHLMEKNP